MPPTQQHRPTVLILGSGFSRDAGLPLVGELTKIVAARLSTDPVQHAGKWITVAQSGQLGHYFVKVPVSAYADSVLAMLGVPTTPAYHYEQVLSALDALCDGTDPATAEDAAQLARDLRKRGIDLTSNLVRSELGRLRNYIAMVVAVELDPERGCWNQDTACGDQHPATSWVLEQWITPLLDRQQVVDVVTTNHDRLIAHVCRDAQIACSSGTNPTGVLAASKDELRSNFEASKARVRVAHVHGAVRWVANRDGSIRDERSHATNLSYDQKGDVIGSERTLVMGYAKLDRILRVPQLAALWTHSEQVLAQAGQIDVCGYGGSDPHVNDLLARAPLSTPITIHAPKEHLSGVMEQLIGHDPRLARCLQAPGNAKSARPFAKS
jgi:hypothetical protein